MRVLPAVLLSLFTSWPASAQTYTISTFAGGGLPVNIPGTSASIGIPEIIAADAAGNVFFVDQNAVLRLDAATGSLTLMAGNGTPGFSGDNGPATSAQLNGPTGLAVDSAGNLYISDERNYRIRKVSSGVITTIAGNGTPGLSGDNGPATSAQLNGPTGLAVDPAGNLYIADFQQGLVREVSNGVITTVAGGGNGNPGDGGPATSALLNYPYGIAVDSSGNLYIADSANHRVRRVSNGVITTVAGTGTPGFSGDNGPAASAQLDYPYGVALDSAGNLYIADQSNNRIRRVSNGAITTIAGNGYESFDGDNGPPASAQLRYPGGVAVDSAGNLYIADSGNNRIRRVSNGVITTVAGNGTAGFSGDNGPAISAQLNAPTGVAIDSLGNLYIADFKNGRIRKVFNGVITTAAGTGTQFFSGDNGPATSAQLNAPRGVAVDSAGNLYVADTDNNRIRKVSGGVITTVAGSALVGFGGDNGPAADISARMVSPSGVAVDSAGNLYIADTGNNRIREVSNEVITTVAGNGNGVFSGDHGPASSAALNSPPGVAVDSAGNLYIADYGNGRVRKVSNGVITTVAGGGNGNPGDSGPATSALLHPAGVAVDSAGNVYVADTDNNRIRLLTPNTSSCTYYVSPTTWQAPAAGGSLTVTIQTTASCSWMVSGLPAWVTVSGASSGSGPATVTLVVAPNSTEAALSEMISVADATISITQPGSSCTYSVSPGGQGFAAAGGYGAIVITTGVGCPWIVTGTPSWISIPYASAGTGNWTVTYQVAATSGAARSGTITIAGLSFTVEQAGASLAGFTKAGSMAQLASAGSWTTTITLVNTTSVPVQVRLNFSDDGGGPLALPLSFPQSPNAPGPLMTATLDRTLNPEAELVIQSTGPSNQPTQVGWAQLLANGPIGGFAVFSQAIGNAVQDAEVPLENRSASAYVVPFDNTNGSATGVALANNSASSAVFTTTIRDDTGTVLLSDMLFLGAMGHTSFNLTDRYASVTAQRRGTMQFTSQIPGQISVLGLRFNATGAFSTIPVLSQ